MFKLLARPVRGLAYAYHTGIRTACTVQGVSGRQYLQGEVIYRDQKNNPTIFKATTVPISLSSAQHFFTSHDFSRRNESVVVLKHEGKYIYKLSRGFADEFAGSRRLRIATDFAPEDHIVVYPYFKCTLLDLMRTDSEISTEEKKKVLRYVGEAIQEFHANGWLHLDIKPSNIFINWTCDENGNKTVTGATLGDLDIAFKLREADMRLRTGIALGNYMWRSPEQQTGSGMTQASDMFSYGLVCIYTLGGADFLLLESERELANLAKHGVTPAEAILTRHFMYFGPVAENLLELVDESKHGLLKKASEEAAWTVSRQPGVRFQAWGQGLGEAGMEVISGMTSIDPSARLTINQVLAHSWWQEC
ncbi:kinase-like protein [Astrocystis sublimbata]|nr:kinase-like protein [Astrocystis sublimbata]